MVRVLSVLCEDKWLQYHVVSDQHVASIELEPALLGGWRVRDASFWGDESWSGMSADAIFRWKLSGYQNVDSVRVDEVLGEAKRGVLMLVGPWVRP